MEGIVNVEQNSIQDQTLVFIRNMNEPKLDGEMTKKQLVSLKRFYEFNEKTNNLNEKTNERLTKMKKKLRKIYTKHPENLVEFNDIELKIEEFKVKENKIINESIMIEQNPIYFFEFEKKFIEKVKNLIEREQNKLNIFDELDLDDKELIDEIMIHWNFCDELNKRFLCRE